MTAYSPAWRPEPDAPRARRCLRVGVVCTVLAFAACAPELDWRELSVPDASFSVLLPCKPQRESRTLGTAGGSLTMTMYACSLKRGTMAVAHTDVPPAGPGADAARAQVDAARDALLRNIGADAGSEEAVDIAGLGGRQIYAEGRAGAQRVVLKARFVVAGTRLYQIAYVGEHDSLAMADVDLFLTSFKLSR